jgi:hypothetical protein
VVAALGVTAADRVLYSGPIGTPEVTPDAYWSIFGRDISIFDWALPVHVHPRQRVAARRGVRDDLASGGGDARPAAHARVALLDLVSR